jgi:hypothetical protein
VGRVTPDQLVDRLRSALTDDLRAIVLYGSSVAGERLSATSDHNVLVIVDALPLGSLRAIGEATHDWVAEGNAPPLIFTVEEWRGSADAFPMEYADILEYHRILFGEPPFAGISVSRAHLRLQVEQDARGKLLHLRRALIAAERDGALHRQILEQTVSQLMVLYRGLLRLHGAPHPTDYEQLTREAARAAGFDAEAVLPAVRHARGTATVSDADAPIVAESYLGALEQLVRHLDSLE